MKTTKQILILSLALILFSCGKDDPAPSQEMVATVDGTAFKAATVVGDDEGVALSIYGFTSSEELSLSVSKDLEVGEHSLDDVDAYFIFTNEDEHFFLSIEGELNITVFTEDRFEATFNFTGDNKSVSGGDDIVVTNGKVRADL